MDLPRVPPKRTRRNAIVALAAGALIVGGTLGLGRLRAAAPPIEKSTVWTDVVRRGPMVREVLGQGTLVPEEVRFIAARTAARVERVLVKPGATVAADTVLAELANSDLELAALEADRELARAEAELTNLVATLNAQQLAQESAIATLTSELGDARRRSEATDELARRGFVPGLDQAQARDRAAELTGRLDFEQRRLAAQARGITAQVSAQKAQIARLRSIAQFRRRELAGLALAAGVDGVLQELTVQPGQSIAAGAPLGKVVRPDRLQAEVRIPETQAKDVRVGQKAVVDTRNGVVPGRVTRIDPAAQAGTVRVDVAIAGTLPDGARPDQNVEATIEIERLPDVLYVARPAFGQPEGTVGLFKLDRDGGGAARTSVRLGRSSVRAIEIRAGLVEGDRVILSDTSAFDDVDRIRLQ